MSSKADRYRENVNRHMESGSKGTLVMYAIFLLSAILSALFFWRHSQGVFSGTPWIFATVLGLLVGLVPSEGAFFAWKDIQKKKEDMTGAQVSASNMGMWLGILFAVMNITGLFLTSFPGVPATVQEITPWLALLALALPIPVQLILFARFSTNEQSVIEAKQRARLNAAKHSAGIKAEEARIGAVLEGMEVELEGTLDDYGQVTGRENAQTALTSGTRNIMEGFYGRLLGSAAHNAPRPAAPATVVNSTHNTPTAELRPTTPAAGQGEYTAEELAAAAEMLRAAKAKSASVPTGNGVNPT